MRSLVPLLLLAGCTLPPTPEIFGPASLDQSRYLGLGAHPPEGSPTRYSAADNCGTPDLWKQCPKVVRPRITITAVDLSSLGLQQPDDTAPKGEQ